MKEINIKCDNCGIRKGETNHWFWLAALDHMNGFISGVAPVPEDLSHRWALTAIEPLDLCGQKCLIAAIDKIINLGTPKT